MRTHITRKQVRAKAEEMGHKLGRFQSNQSRRGKYGIRTAASYHVAWCQICGVAAFHPWGDNPNPACEIRCEAAKAMDNTTEVVRICPLCKYVDGNHAEDCRGLVDLSRVDIPLFKRQRDALNDVLTEEISASESGDVGNAERIELLGGLQDLCDHIYDSILPPNKEDNHVHKGT